jgi:lantibiotic modifying enzyme
MWKVISDRYLSRKIFARVHSIALELMAQDDVPASAGISRGLPGMALFLAYAANATNTKEYAIRSLSMVDRAIAELETATRLDMHPFTGFPGSIWAIDHTLHVLGELGPAESISLEYDSLAMEMVASPWQPGYDLIGGLVGHGLFALLRSARGAATVLAVLDRLSASAEPMAGGIAWRTPQRTLAGEQERSKYPNGNFNLGMAHGTAGAIALLAEARSAGIAIPRGLLEGALSWLVSVRNPEGMPSAFGYNAEEPTVSRLAWCYGDPGVLLALLKAEISGCSECSTFTRCVAEKILHRSIDTSMVVDAGLCHGAAGLAHLYNVFFQVTGDVRFKALCISMYKHALSICDRDQEAYGQFWKRRTVLGHEIGLGYLIGAAGTGLALLASVSTLEPDWDAPLFVGAHTRGR